MDGRYRKHQTGKHFDSSIGFYNKEGKKKAAGETRNDTGKGRWRHKKKLHLIVQRKGRKCWEAHTTGSIYISCLFL